jgi:hypothetical protein
VEKGMRMDEVTDEPLYRDRVCGIDIGKAGMAATIRVPSVRSRPVATGLGDPGPGSTPCRFGIIGI